MRKVSKYIYYDHTISLCNVCRKKVDAKIIFEGNNVYMTKSCNEHGRQKVLISNDIEFYKRKRNYNKPSDYPLAFNTKTERGCPDDCGLCPDHEQHSCLTLIEVTDRCNLACPTCYASSAPNYGRHRTLEEIDRMLDIIVRNEGEPDVVQISGGEPTIHPQFFEILDLAKTKPIRHLMVNTNGIRIAKDKEFVKRLAGYMPDFEIYLQFDSFDRGVLADMRGEDLLETRQQAIANLNEVNLSTTLVVTLQRGKNEHEIGEIIRYGAAQKCVRGVTLQATQYAGRNEHYNPDTGKLSIDEIRKLILEQTSVFNENDLIPVPCNPDALTMGYALKQGNELVPLTRFIDPEMLLENTTNTIVFESDENLKENIFKIFSTGTSVERAGEVLNEIMCCLPKIDAPNMTYSDLFRIILINFQDAYDFDIRSIKKSCVHIVHKDGRIIPFETMNMFYRN
ncbi:MAG: radical SAM protein [Bacteroidetes bacterium]|nr:radical SAM protein [Bacteroidota bacterium]